MKKIFCTLTMVMAIGVMLHSCKKDETKPNNNNNNTTDTNFYFTAKIDGVDWAADKSTTNLYYEIPHANFLSIFASMATVTDGFFLVNISGYTGAGTYIIGGSGNNSYGRYTTGTVANNSYSSWKAEDPGSATTGTVVITKDDANILEGTIVFDGYSEEKKTTKTITDGKFRIKKK